MDIKVQNVRPEFKELLRCNGLTLGNWNKFKRLFNQKDITEKDFYDRVLIKVIEIRNKYRKKDIVISEIEEIFVNDIKKVSITGSYKNKNSKEE